MYFLPKKRLIKYSTLNAKWVLIVCSLFTPVALAACNSNAPVTTPSNDFTVHNDGTVTHKTTGLMWKVCSEGQAWILGACTGTITTHSWDVALQAPETINTSFPLSGGVTTSYTDWRLPNLKELKSVVELQCYSPAINEAVFPNTAGFFYWSSSPLASSDSYTWGVNFNSGSDTNSNRTSLNRVRLVRAGE